MRSTVRFLVVWMMVLAVPLQSMAKATMQHCAGALSPVHAEVMALQHDGHGHRHAELAVAEPATPEPREPGEPGEPGDAVSAVAFEDIASSAGHECSACSACCAGAALPATVADLPRPVHGLETDAVDEPFAASFVASGPDRPPRQTLA